MFTTVAKAVTWWVSEPAVGETESPILMVARGLAAVNPEAVKPCMDMKIIAGAMYGIIEQNNLTMMQACLKDSRQVAHNVKDGLQLIEKLDSYDIAEGFRVLANAFDDVPTLHSDCTHI